jgi:hypothetical protein
MTALRARGLELPAEAMLFQARYPLPTLRFGGLEVDALPRRCVSPGQLEVGVTRLGEAAECWAAFNPQRYVAADVAQFLDDIAGFADTVGAAPDQPMADLWP